jgi:hypothetical protein
MLFDKTFKTHQLRFIKNIMKSLILNFAFKFICFPILYTYHLVLKILCLSLKQSELKKFFDFQSVEAKDIY